MKGTFVYVFFVSLPLQTAVALAISDHELHVILDQFLYTGSPTLMYY